MKLLRTIRLDASDTFVFPIAAEPGDWAVAGTFAFADGDPARLEGKERAAFRSGFLGVPSLGWSTLAQVVEVGEPESRAALDALAQCLLTRFGAPDPAAAAKAAEEELEFARSLSDHPVDTLIAIRRSVEEGEIRESFRTLKPRADAGRWRPFAFVEAPDEEEPEERIDLARLARGEGR